jgi:hypothetical protein
MISFDPVPDHMIGGRQTNKIIYICTSTAEFYLSRNNMEDLRVTFTISDTFIIILSSHP